MSKQLNLKNAPKATGRVLDDTEERTLKPIGNALNEAFQELDEDLSAPTAEIKDAIGNPEHKAPKHDPVAQAEAASKKLEQFTLSPLASALLDRAMVNVSENTGRGIEDELARDQVNVLASIVKASGDSLTQAIEVIVETIEGDAGTYVYKLCYAVQKALNFIGNMTYRRALDPKADFDLEMFIDQREDHREPPCGLGPDEQEVAFDAEGNRIFNVAGGEEVKTDYEQIIDALETLHVYLQILTESFGWDADRPMPYMALFDEQTQTFTHIMECEECLDRMELRFKESKVKRQEKQLAGMKLIQAAALKALKQRSK